MHEKWVERDPEMTDTKMEHIMWILGKDIGQTTETERLAENTASPEGTNMKICASQR